MARISFVLVVFTILIVVGTSLGARVKISLVNNGYEGILVAISESVDVSESVEMIRRIKVRTYMKKINTTLGNVGAECVDPYECV